MYFGIIGHHTDIHLKALSYLHPYNLSKQRKHTVFFDTDYPERLSTCGALIKRGYLTDDQGLAEAVKDNDMVGAGSNDLGKELKKRFPHIKRYKEVEILHTDKEIKEGGKEIFSFLSHGRGVVIGYQDISLYEIIDFDKPCHGMEVGMMPSKLAHNMINIGVGERERVESGKSKVERETQLASSWKGSEAEGSGRISSNRRDASIPQHDANRQNSKIPTIRDPFCGFGTTNFLANALGYNTIGSDINIAPAKQNAKWWQSQGRYHPEKKVLFDKYDVNNTCSNLLFHHADIIISEGWLGYVITNKTRPKEAENSSLAAEKLYKTFLDNLTTFFQSSKKPENQTAKILVITIPVWLKHNHNFSISESIASHANTLGRDTEILPEPYSRSGQLVGRQVMIGRY